MNRVAVVSLFAALSAPLGCMTDQELAALDCGARPATPEATIRASFFPNHVLGDCEVSR